MMTYLFYTKGSRHQAAIESFADQLERRGVKTELVEADSVRGTQLVTTYDITERPAVVVTGPDGTVMERWLGSHLPLASDVSYLVHR